MVFQTFFSVANKGLSIYYVIRDGGRGLPNLLQYYIGGGLPNLLQCYTGGFFKVHYNITDLVGIWKGLDLFSITYVFMLCAKVRILSQNCKKNREYAILEKYT